jgi:uncharacterized DUF497 family protein
MKVEWDARKQRENLHKHGIELADAVAVLEDPAAVTVEDLDYDEQRFVTLGMDAIGRVLVVVYSYPGPDRIRIISARKAGTSERRHYQG